MDDSAPQEGLCVHDGPTVGLAPDDVATEAPSLDPEEIPCVTLVLNAEEPVRQLAAGWSEPVSETGKRRKGWQTHELRLFSWGEGPGVERGQVPDAFELVDARVVAHLDETGPVLSQVVASDPKVSVGGPEA